jgi:hypothetical protein
MDIFKKDVVAVNVNVTVKTCTGKTVKAELDLVVKDTVYELKNWQAINPGDARKMVAQMSRQTDVTAAFKGKHGGLIIGDKTTMSDAAKQVFKEQGVPVQRAVEGKLKAVVTVE